MEGKVWHIKKEEAKSRFLSSKISRDDTDKSEEWKRQIRNGNVGCRIAIDLLPEIKFKVILKLSIWVLANLYGAKKSKKAQALK